MLASTHSIKNICFIGAGYVGGPTSAVFAQQCPFLEVHVVDANEKRIDAWNSDCLPIYEPGLQDIVRECRHRNLFFSTDVDGAIERADLIFICVNTPTKTFGIGRGRAPDLSSLDAVARQISSVARSPKVVVEKSTVPVKAAESLRLILEHCRPLPATKIQDDRLVKQNGDHSASPPIRHIVLSNPEFLAEGCAIENLLHPDRVLIGGSEESEEGRAAISKLMELYLHWVPRERILTMNTWSAELSKLAANAMLAQRVSSVNAFTEICEATGADIGEVTRAVASDSRIGSKFLQPSLGFGGSCFQKDILNLVYLCEALHLTVVARYWEQVLLMNDYQKSRFACLIAETMFGTLAGKRIAIFGFSFKANTQDTRESAAIDVCRHLLDEGAHLSIFDPQVPLQRILHDLSSKCHVHSAENGDSTLKVEVCTSPEEAAREAHAIIVCTEWPQFRDIDYEKVYRSMQRPSYVFDGRRVLDHARLAEIGFLVHVIGTSPAALEGKKMHYSYSSTFNGNGHQNGHHSLHESL